jgi:hypothetical protein
MDFPAALLVLRKCVGGMNSDLAHAMVGLITMTITMHPTSTAATITDMATMTVTMEEVITIPATLPKQTQKAWQLIPTKILRTT